MTGPKITRTTALAAVAPPTSSACRRNCCWTPYGHSSAVIGCACHPPTTAMLAAIHNDPTHPDAA